MKKITFLPQTKFGMWTVGLINSFFILVIAFLLLIKSGEKGGETFFENLILAIPLTLASISGIASFLVGLISVIKYKERSISVIASILLGLIILLFTYGELFVSH